MVEPTPGLEALFAAILRGDEAEVVARRQEFGATNPALTGALDRLAHADFLAGHFAAAAGKLALLEEFLPDAPALRLRRLLAAIRAGTPGAAEALAGMADRFAEEGHFFNALDEMVRLGRMELAAQVATAGEACGRFSAGILAAARARILAGQGRITNALGVLAPELAAERPHSIVLRLHYLLAEQRLDLAAAREGAIRATRVWGEAHHLHHAIDRLLLVFETDRAAALLEEATAAHPALRPAAEALAPQVAAAAASVVAALAEHGPVAPATVAEIHAALAEPGTPASRILWGKRALVALLEEDRLAAPDFARFAWFLPNWEDARVRALVLAAARRRFAKRPAVRRAWLSHLMAQAAYGDAADACRAILAEGADEEALFHAILLLRRHQDGVVPPFLVPRARAALREAVLAALPAAGLGFRCVMQPHAEAIGAPAEAWPDAAISTAGTREAAGFRRLFAAGPGRLPRRAVALPRRAGPVRPVVAISGQLRGFTRCWPSLHRWLVEPLGAPVVCTVWDRSSNATGRHAQRLERALPADLLATLAPEERFTDAFEQAFPDTYALMFGSTEVTPEPLAARMAASGAALLAVETESEAPIERVTAAGHPNMLKMFYKMARLEALLREAEAGSGEVFSHVVWTRPDCAIEQLAPEDLRACLGAGDIAYSAYITENTMGDHMLVLPRRAFAAVAGIFPRVATADDTRLLPWRPNRNADPAQPFPLESFGGTDVLFDVLLAAGFVPAAIPRLAFRLLAGVPEEDVLRRAFAAERAARGR